ncbi:hypothetical protein C5748_16375 [Phyllobacterium phragmitis]|uniref:Uncharacterized protein n=2 Tax=Phyllobacterium phragmitis TaxID=2670329 RepID=A0A2S9IPB7_9HYPH|nr:hypothetical protein C5748_16375 [Phyllobacterium phragmitis]
MLEADMAIKVTYELDDMDDALSTLEDTYGELRGFTHLLHAALWENGGLKHLSHDICRIPDRIVNDLQTIHRCMVKESRSPAEDEKRLERHEQAAEYAAEYVKNKGLSAYEMVRPFLLQFINDRAELERVGEIHDISPDNVRSVLLHVALPNAYSARSDAETDGQEPVLNENARDQSIAAKIKEGVDASAIAQTLNLKTATVEKVIAQLLGSSGTELSNETDQSDLKRVVNE